ncbi:MAG: tetratricopeptide repeat protein [Deltaproteobacteria bacterium]|nr:MAG: tetratricopeptide repeat protein [Deltaproteobacteria bacterium]
MTKEAFPKRKKSIATMRENPKLSTQKMSEREGSLWEKLKKARISLVVLGLLVVISVTIYYNSLDTSFHFDDHYAIEENRNIKNLSDIRTIATFNRTRPLLFLTFALNYYFSGLDTWGYHLVNLLLHIFNGCLIYFIISITYKNFISPDRRIGRQENTIALLSSLLFVIHPIQTEAVSYIISRSSLLSTFFYLLGVFLFIQFNDKNEEDVKHWLFYLGSILCFILGMLTKEILITLPVILIIYDYCFISSTNYREFLPRLRRYHLPFLSIMIGFFFFRYFLVGTLGNPTDVRPVVTNVITEGRVIVNYFRLLVFPVHLNPDPDFPISRSLMDKSIIISIIIFLFLLTISLRLYLSNRTIFFGASWFFITILPTSSIIPLRDVMAEHRLYLPSIGFFLVSSVVMNAGFEFSQRKLVPIRMKNIFLLGLLTLFSFFGLGTVARNVDWKDEVSLWKDTVKKSPNKARPHNNFGLALKIDGVPEKAKIHYFRALKLYPDYADAHYNLGLIYYDEGEKDKALKEFKETIRIQADYAKAHYNAGIVLMEKRLFDEAIEEYQKTIHIDPYFVNAYNNLGLVYVRQGLFDQGIEQYRRGLRIDPNSQMLRTNLGSAYYEMGKKGEGEEELKRAIKINPEYMPARLNLAKYYESQNMLDEAITQYQAAIQLKPESVGARINLGAVYYKKGDYGKAVAEFQGALKFNPKAADAALAHTNIGAIYADNLNNPREALSHYQESIVINPSQPQAAKIMKKIEELKAKLNTGN